MEEDAIRSHLEFFFAFRILQHKHVIRELLCLTSRFNSFVQGSMEISKMVLKQSQHQFIHITERMFWVSMRGNHL